MRGPRGTRPASPPIHLHPGFAIPEHEALHALHRAFARGGLPSPGQRTPAEQARLVGFRILSELLTLLGEFKGRIERGEPCHLVEHLQVHQAGRLVLEFSIEPLEARP
jgi:hypothetical protein